LLCDIAGREIVTCKPLTKAEADELREKYWPKVVDALNREPGESLLEWEARAKSVRESLRAAQETSSARCGCKEFPGADEFCTAHKAAAAGHAAYSAHVESAGIHSNRFPSWGELMESERDEWIKRAAANR
jgi:hypothetical protein